VFASTIQEIGGTKKTVAAGVERLTEMLPVADAARRTRVSAGHLILGTNCGGSDSYSGLTANPALGNAVDRLVHNGGTGIVGEDAGDLRHRAHAGPPGGVGGGGPQAAGADRLVARLHRAQRRLDGQQPVPGNKAGGLTTILEKSLGAVAKGGTTTLADVVEYAAPVTTPGFVFMDTPGYDPVSVTGIVAGGANVVCFTTGRGSAFGCAPVPSLKLATNTPLYEHMSDDMDINAGGIVDGTTTVEELGAVIFDRVLAVASGEPTKSEAMDYGEEEFVPWHLGTVM